jgi:hypothetical protein
MPTYVEPSRWNETAKTQSERARKLRNKVEESSSPSSRIWQTTAYLAGKKQGQAADAARRHIENMDESMAEDSEQQVADQYPKGTKYAGRTSRNRAGYGKPVDLPAEGKAKGGKVKGYASGGKVRGGGCERQGKTKGRFV